MDVFPPNLADLRPFQPISVRSDRSPPVPTDLRPFRPSSVRSDRSPPVPTNLRPFRPSSVRSAQSVTIGDGPHPEIGRRSQMLQFTIDPPRLLCWRRGYVLGWAGLWSRVSLSLTLAECVCRSRVRVCFVRRCSESRTGRAGGAWKPSQRPEPDVSGGSEGRVRRSSTHTWHSQEHDRPGRSTTGLWGYTNDLSGTPPSCRGTIDLSKAPSASQGITDL